MNDDGRTDGQVLYEAYGDHAGWLSIRGEPLPAWVRQDPVIQGHWEFAAEKLLRQQDGS